VRYFVSRQEPPGGRILFVESGSRSLAEVMLGHMAEWDVDCPLDLVTCYAALPAGFDPATEVFRVFDYPGKEGRKRLLQVLKKRDYAYIGIICSTEPIMLWWKWFLALRLPAKLFIVNENGDYFWFHRDNLDSVRAFALERSGLTGAGAARTLGRLMAFPFTLFYLLMYAFTVHARRRLRLALSGNSQESKP
jgi:hypothetical protein